MSNNTKKKLLALVMTLILVTGSFTSVAENLDGIKDSETSVESEETLATKEGRGTDALSEENKASEAVKADKTNSTSDTFKSEVTNSTTDNLKEDIKPLLRAGATKGEACDLSFYDDAEFKYTTGKRYVFYTKIIISGNNIEYPSSKLSLKIPKKHILKPEPSTTEIVVSGTNGANISDEVLEKEDHWLVNIKFDNIKGGSIVEVPIKIGYENLKTPPNFSTNMELRFVDKENTILSTINQEMTALATKKIPWSGATGNTYGGFSGVGFENLEKPGYYKGETGPIFLQTGISFHSNSPGTYVAQSARTFHIMPEGCIVLPNSSLKKVPGRENVYYRDQVISKKTLYVDAYPMIKLNENFKGNTKYKIEHKVFLVEEGEEPPQFPEEDTPDLYLYWYRSVGFYDAFSVTKKLLTPPAIYLPENKDSVLEYKIGLESKYNSATDSFEFSKIVDSLKYGECFDFLSCRINIPDGLNIPNGCLYGVKDGVEEKINIDYNQGETVDLKYKGYRTIFFRFPEGSPMVLTRTQLEQFKVYVKTTYNSEAWDDGRVTNASRCQNRAYFTGGLENSETKITKEGGNHSGAAIPYIVNGWAECQTNANNTMDIVNGTSGYTRKLRIIMRPTNPGPPFDYVYKDPKFIFIMPQGVELKTSTFKIPTLASSHVSIKSIESKYKLEDVGGEEKTRKIVTISLEGEIAKNEISWYDPVTIEYEYTENTENGQDVVRAYCAMGNLNMFVGGALNKRILDVEDLDNNIETTNITQFLNHKYDFKPPKTVKGNSEIGEQAGNNQVYVNESVGKDLLGNLEYRLTLNNMTTEDLTQLQMVDVLPHVGDKAIVKKQGELELPFRGSRYDVKLRGPITVPENYTVQYSTDAPAGEAKDIYNNFNWKNALEISDFSKVTTFRITLKSGQIMPKESKIHITLPCKIPFRNDIKEAVYNNDGSLESGDMAYNSFAFSVNGGGYQETKKNETPISYYHTKGTAFNDLNENGIMDPGETPLSGVKVSLLQEPENGAKADWAPVKIYKEIKDDEGNVERIEEIAGNTFTTGMDGSYDILTLKRGNYKVKMEKAGYHVTTKVPLSGESVTNSLNQDGIGDAGLYMPLANKLKASGGFKETIHTLTYHKGNVPAAYTIENIPDAVTVAEGKDHDIIFNPEPAGYTEMRFLGWSKNIDSKKPEYPKGKAAAITMGTEDITLYAIWASSKQYTVTYNANGGNQASSPTDANNYYEGDTVNVNHDTFPTRDNHVFLGWAKTGDADTPLYPKGTPANFEMGTENVTLYAVWEENDKYTVTYNVNGGQEGSQPVDSKNYYELDPVTVDFSKIPVREHYTFLGWSNTQTGSADYTESGANTFKMPASDKTLYAVWQENPKYKVTYDADLGEGSVPQDTKSYYENENVDVQFTPAPTRAHHQFLGWATSANQYVPVYTSTGLKNFAMPNNNVTLYGVYKQDPRYEVRYHKGAGEGIVPTDNTLYYEGDSATIQFSPAPRKVHYKFIGWSQTENSDVPQYSSSSVKTLIMPKKNVDLYPVFKETEPYKVTYDANGISGEVPEDTKEYYYDDNQVTVKFTPNPGTVKNTFLGWSEDKNAATPTYTESGLNTFNITKSTTLYAIYQENPPFSVIYDANNGNGPVPVDTSEYYETYTAGVIFSPQPTRTHYKFLGWSEDKEAESPTYVDGGVTSLTMGKSSVTLYAVWEEEEPYHLTYDANGGTGGPNDSENYYKTDTANIKFEPAPEKKNFTFIGWSEDENAETPTYTSDGTTTITFVNKSRTLYAVYEENQKYKVTYHEGQGVGQVPQDNTNYYGGDTVGIQFAPTPTRENYEFKGWAQSRTDTVAEFTIGGLSSLVMPEHDVDLYPIWKENIPVPPVEHVEVIYEVNGKEHSREVLLKGETPKNIPNIILDKKEMAGWEVLPYVEAYGVNSQQSGVNAGVNKASIYMTREKLSKYPITKDTVCRAVIKDKLDPKYPAEPDDPYEYEPNEEIIEGPYTGDEENAERFIFAILGSLIGLVVLRRRRREEN